MNSTFLLKHKVDISLLTDGFNIPLEFHQLVYALPNGVISHGEKRDIKILIGGEIFSAKLNNIGFDKDKYAGHPDLLQIRYSSGSAIAKKLQALFADDYQYLLTRRQIVGPRKQISLPEDNHDEIVLYGTAMKDVFILDCVRTELQQQAAMEVHQMSELDFETSWVAREDVNAGIKEITGIKRIRQLDRSIGDSLKQLYDYRCQMTGERIGDEYQALVVEAHHIIPFTESMNNDTSNIIILSPSYHRIIHKAKPIWLAEQKAFSYPNGLVETVKLNKHL